MTKVSQWIKLLGGSLLFAVGFFFLFEAFASVEIWNFYQNEPNYNILYQTTFLDNVLILLLLGIPLLIVGSAFTIKGMREYLKEK